MPLSVLQLNIKKMGKFSLPHITPTGLQSARRDISQPLKGRAHAILQMNT
jgi:hypothetical protein